MEIREFFERKWQPVEWFAVVFITIVLLFIITKLFQGDTEEKSTLQLTEEYQTIDAEKIKSEASVETDKLIQESSALSGDTLLSNTEEDSQESIVAELDEAKSESNDDEKTWELGLSQSIKGTQLLMLPLVSESNANIGQKIGQASPAKNVLFMDTKTNESYWIFDDVERLILDIKQFPSPVDYTAEVNSTQAIFYDTIMQDTNGDGNISSDDSTSLMVSSPNGKSYQVILDEYDKIISRTITDDKKVFMVYQNSGTDYSMLFQLNPYAIISQKELPQVGSRSRVAGCTGSIENSDEAIDCAIYHGGKIADLTAARDELSSEQTGSYWVVTQEASDDHDSYWEFVLTQNGNLMSMKQVDRTALQSVLE